MKLTVKVIGDDIRYGMRSSVNQCAVSRAVRRALIEAGLRPRVVQTASSVSVAIEGMRWGGFTRRLSDNVVAFIRRFDHGDHVDPIEFDLDLPIPEPIPVPAEMKAKVEDRVEVTK